MNYEAVTGVGLSALLVLLWADDVFNVWRDWRTFRDVRSFRTFLKATLLFIGAIAFLLGALYVYLWPQLVDVARAWGWVVRSGMFIVGGVIFVSRHRWGSPTDRGGH